MRRIRLFTLGIVSFFAVLMGGLLAPGTFVNRALSAALCTVFSFNSTVCTVNLARSGDRVVAANSPVVERSISDWLVQRAPGEFDDAPSAPQGGNNPQVPPFPQDPGPNFPVRPDFDGSDTNSKPAVVDEFTANSNFRDLQLGANSFIDTKGCEQIAEIKSNGDSKYLESAVVHIPNNGISCSSGSFEILAKYTVDGNSVTLTSMNNNSPIVIQGLRDNTWRIIYTDKSGVERKETFNIGDISSAQHIIVSDLPKNSKSNNNKSLSKKSSDFIDKNINHANETMVASSTSERCKQEKNYCSKLKKASDLIKAKMPELGELLSNPLGYWFDASAAILITKIPPHISSTLLITWSIMAFQDANYCFYYYGETGGYHTDMLISLLKISGKTPEETTNKLEQVASANRQRAEQRCSEPSQSPQPQQTAPVVTARISQVDDVATIYVDGKIVFEGFYGYGGKGGDTGWQPINVGSGRHQVRLVVENTMSGESGGWFEIKVNGELKINQGRPFQEDQITGIKYDQTTTLEVS